MPFFFENQNFLLPSRVSKILSRILLITFKYFRATANPVISRTTEVKELKIHVKKLKIHVKKLKIHVKKLKIHVSELIISKSFALLVFNVL
ncbi:hypothetical protein AZI11_14675 (plasmid) [Levilactobacillus brevis]|nr:hypothetical protein AZI11_14675 [Levilactobacillus brevis]